MFTIVLWWGVIGWCLSMVSIGFLIDCHMRSKAGTPSASHNIPVAEIADEIDYVACTLDTITKEGLGAKMRQWCRQLRNR